MAKTNLTAQRLRELLEYDPETGVFTWRVRPSNRVKVGDVSGCAGGGGYLYIRICGVLHGAHRMAWLYMTGEWPKFEVDHRDGDPANNRFKNLRDVTPSINQQNRRSGKKLLGAYFHKASAKWMAQIVTNRVPKYLGLFDSEAQAHAAYIASKRELHPHATINGINHNCPTS